MALNKNIFKQNNPEFNMQNKRGQMSTETIVYLIIGLVILVIVVLTLTMGKERIFPFFFSTNNVDNIKTNCVAACATNNEYNYCTSKRTLKAEDLPGGVKEVKGSCNSFAQTTTPFDYTIYGIERCPSLEDETSCQNPPAPSSS